MFSKKCRCGNNSKSFKRDIGSFFIDDCCLAKGYDHLGNKDGEPPVAAPVKATVKNLSPSQKLDQSKNKEHEELLAKKKALQDARADEIAKAKERMDKRARSKAKRLAEAQEKSEE